MDAFLLERSLIKSTEVTSAVLDLNWPDETAYMAGLSQKSRRHQKRDVLPWEEAYDLEVVRAGDRMLSDEEQAHLYQLYQNVKARNLELNVFNLPREMFAKMLDHRGWELVLLRLKPCIA